MKKELEYVKVFTRSVGGRKELRKMLKFRKRGYSYNLLALMYGCHHTTIIHHCQKAKVKPDKGARPKTMDMYYRGKIRLPKVDLPETNQIEL